MPPPPANPTTPARPRRKRKHPGTIRTTLGATLLAAALATAILWTASGWWRFRLSLGQCLVRIGRGQMFIYRGETTKGHIYPASPEPFFSVGPLTLATGDKRFDWLSAPERFPPPFEWEQFKTRDWNLAIIAQTTDTRSSQQQGGPGVTYARCWGVALWPLPLPLLALGGRRWYTGRRARRWSKEGTCPACGYQLTGLEPGASCPECGR